MEANLSGPACGPGRGIRARERVNPIAGTLERSTLLEADDLDALRSLPYRAIEFMPGQVVLEETARASKVLIVLDGLAAVQTDFPDGTRQITDILLAGDLHGASAILGAPYDHAITALTRLSVAFVATADLAAMATRPRVCGALFWAAHRQERILRDHVRIVGRRNARKRLAHLLCWLQARRTEAGGDIPETFRLDLTHSALADAIGMTDVHVGRVLRALSRERIVRTGRCGIAVVNGTRLRAVAEFQEER